MHWIVNKAHDAKLTIIISSPANGNGITVLFKETPQIMHLLMTLAE